MMLMDQYKLTNQNLIFLKKASFIIRSFIIAVSFEINLKNKNDINVDTKTNDDVKGLRNSISK